MKTQVTQITCNVCLKPIEQVQHGSGLYRGQGNGHTGTVWLSSLPYEDLAKYDTHICNRCHVELSWCHPGGVNNPTRGSA